MSITINWKAKLGAINQCIASAAGELVVGATREDLYPTAETLALPRPDTNEVLSGWGQISSWSRRAHEFDWHRLACIAAKGIGADGTIELQEIDWVVLGRRAWCPPIFFPQNLPEYRTGLIGHASGGWLELDLSVPDDIEDSPSEG